MREGDACKGEGKLMDGRVMKVVVRDGSFFTSVNGEDGMVRMLKKEVSWEEC